MNNVALLRSIITEAAQSVVGTSLTFVEQERVVAQTMARLVAQHGGTDTEDPGIQDRDEAGGAQAEDGAESPSGREPAAVRGSSALAEP